MKRFFYVGALALLIASLAVLENRAIGQTPAATAPDPHRALLNTYCVDCHNTRLKTGGLALDDLDLADRRRMTRRSGKRLCASCAGI